MDSEKQKIKLQKVRDALGDFITELEDFRQSDWYLLKFLQEHHFNVKSTVDSIKHATQWKKSFKVHLLTEEKRLEFLERFPYDTQGFDNEGRPVLIVPFGRWKIREAVENGERDNFIRHAINMTESNQERLKDAINCSNGEINNVIIIFDLKEYSIKQLMHRQTISTLSEWTKLGEELYPQQLKSFYVINANKIMPILFSLLKPFMSHNTVSRVQIYDSDEGVWQNELFNHINRDQLPKEYGGTKE